MSFQKVTIDGNIGFDPEWRANKFDTSKQEVRASLCCNRKTKDRNTGETRENITWYNLQLSAAQGEKFMEYVRKGDRVLIFGELFARAYSPSGGGEAKLFMEVRVSDWYKLSSSRADSGPTSRPVVPRGASGGATHPAPLPARKEPAPAPESYEDDIPF